jgi:hypothetical protein
METLFGTLIKNEELPLLASIYCAWQIPLRKLIMSQRGLKYYWKRRAKCPALPHRGVVERIKNDELLDAFPFGKLLLRYRKKEDRR